MSEQIKIKVQLKHIVKSDEACESLGLNPWCLAEGADGNDWYTVNLSDAREWGLI